MAKTSAVRVDNVVSASLRKAFDSLTDERAIPCGECGHPPVSMFAATCGTFRDMRLAGAFFANRAEVVDDMLNVEGGFWASTTVPARSTSFQCSCVALCDTRRRDVGTHYALHIDAAGPTGQRWTSAWTTKFQLRSPMKFMVLPQVALPIEPHGGRHVYSFRLEGSHERFDIPLDVIVQ